jgi:uncharacterized protein YbbC (DUF1343 family)
MKPGLDVVFERYRGLVRGKRIGLIVNPASVNRTFHHASDLFLASPDCHLVALFGPQHGISSTTQDNMIQWEGGRDERTGLPVYSLYGATRIPTEEMVRDLDALVCDLPDVGTRVYTFAATMANCMIAARQYDKEMIVLDRPNPIGGVQVEGGLVEPGFESFVGMFPIPLRHGMTMGELALLFNEAFGIGCRLSVVPMDGWQRQMWYDQTDLPWIMPSPNMPTLDTATVYPGTVLVEGTLLSEGRGTTRPFELIGAPFIDPYRLVKQLAGEKLPGVFFRPCFFTPTFQKHQGKVCGGVQIHVLDRRQFKPVITGIALLKAIHRLYPDQFAWRQPPYEYVYDKLPFDVIAGSDRLRQQIVADIPLAEIEASWQSDLTRFLEMRRPYLLY